MSDRKFTDVLRGIRKRFGYNMNEFGQKLGYNGSGSYSKIEEGENIMSIGKLHYMMRTLHLTAKEAEDLSRSYVPNKALSIYKDTLASEDHFALACFMAARLDFLSLAEQCAIEAILCRNARRSAIPMAKKRIGESEHAEIDHS